PLRVILPYLQERKGYQQVYRAGGHTVYGVYVVDPGIRCKDGEVDGQYADDQIGKLRLSVLIQLSEPRCHLMLLRRAVKYAGSTEPEGRQGRNAGKNTHDNDDDSQPMHTDDIRYSRVYDIGLRDPLVADDTA